jgi:hypothetical protein
MANPLDTDAGSELFSSYEADLRLVQADLGQKLDQIPELAGEPRKALIRQAQHCVDEASELVWSNLYNRLIRFFPSSPHHNKKTDISRISYLSLADLD